jgi:Pyrimidine dimer DNA glycosylase
MNLFILSLDPAKTAEYMMDKHIAKIILEAVQMLCTTQRLLLGGSGGGGGDIDPCVYKIAHKNHPVTIWCRASQANFIWTLDLVDAMHAEWKYRYGHPAQKQHKSYIVAQYLRLNIPPAAAFERVKVPGIMTPFALAMPDEYKVRASSSGDGMYDAVASYRSYYLSEPKRRIAKWGKLRGMPVWYARGLRKILGKPVPKLVIVKR